MEIQILNEDISGNKLMIGLFLHDFSKNKPSDDDIQNSQIFIRNVFGVNEMEDVEDLNNLDILNIGKKRKIPSNENMDLSLLINQIDNYISYYGSLTSPPCNEGVKWVLIRQKISVFFFFKDFNNLNFFKISSFEIKAFQNIFGKDSNVRGLQDLGDRELNMF